MNFSSIGQRAAALAAMLCSCAMAAAAPPAVSATSAAPAAMAALAKARAGVHNPHAPVAVPTTADRHSANGVVAEGAAAASANEAANVAANVAPNVTTNDAAGDAELEGTRGGAGVTTVDTRIAGQVSGNSANNVQSGWNIIDGGAFANITGIPIVIQNSGANVLIQNATVIQLQLQ